MKLSEVFLTDAEFEALFTPEIAGLIHTLNEVSKEQCTHCGGRCCQEVGCKLFSVRFSSCPIYEIRPRECRYHFCHRILEKAPLDEEQKELLLRPVTEFTRGNSRQITEVFPCFPAFPLSEDGLSSLGIKEAVGNVMRAFEQGELCEEVARASLRKICRHR
jgi:hypothetical protein